jgi:flagellar hook-associated protein 1 FlgK
VSLLGALSVGARGLAVASAGIDVTSQNVTGAQTPGFTRRTLSTRQLAPVQQGALFVGQGATASGVSRVTDRLLGVRLVDAAGANSAASTLARQLSAVDTAFDFTNSTGLGEAIDLVFDALGSATADPSDASQRRAVVHALSTFASTASRIAGGLEGAMADADEELGSGLESVNAVLREVAVLNAQIGRQGASTGPADLLDRRDQLLVQLAQEVGATVQLKADGQAFVYVAGHAVVGVGDYRELSLGQDADGDPVVQVSMDGGTFDITDHVGGSVGGLVSARDRMDGWLADLDEFAFTVANAFNTQHAAGYDRSGAAGGDLFQVGTTAAGSAAGLVVDSALLDDPDLLAFAGDPTAYAGDGVNLEALLALEDDAAMFSSGTARSAASALVADVGSAVAEAYSDSEAQAALLSDLQSLRDGVSGVNTDEEATHLLEYQAAYRAAAKVMSAADELLQTLLSLGG